MRKAAGLPWMFWESSDDILLMYYGILCIFIRNMP